MLVKFYWGDPGNMMWMQHKRAERTCICSIGKAIKLLWFKNSSNKPTASKIEGQSFLMVTSSENEFELEAKETQKIHVMVVKAKVEDVLKNIVKKAPEKVQQLLEEFQELVVMMCLISCLL